MKPDQLTQDLAMIARNAIDYIRELERERDALLEALKEAADFLEHSTEFRLGHPGFERVQARARAAIAKAEGMNHGQA